MFYQKYFHFHQLFKKSVGYKLPRFVVGKLLQNINKGVYTVTQNHLIYRNYLEFNYLLHKTKSFKEKA